MTRLDALRALYDSIKAGTLPDEVVCPTAFADDFHNGYRCVEAYHGSVDAALAFIAATLPGWKWAAGSDYAGVFPSTPGQMYSAEGHPATALLLAGLAALIAEEAARIAAQLEVDG